MLLDEEGVVFMVVMYTVDISWIYDLCYCNDLVLHRVLVTGTGNWEVVIWQK